MKTERQKTSDPKKILDVLYSDDWRARKSVAEFRQEEIGDDIIAIGLGDPDPRVRTAFAQIDGFTPNDRQLRTGLEDSDASVRGVFCGFLDVEFHNELIHELIGNSASDVMTHIAGLPGIVLEEHEIKDIIGTNPFGQEKRLSALLKNKELYFPSGTVFLLEELFEKKRDYSVAHRLFLERTDIGKSERHIRKVIDGGDTSLINIIIRSPCIIKGKRYILADDEIDIVLGSGFFDPVLSLSERGDLPFTDEQLAEGMANSSPLISSNFARIKSAKENSGLSAKHLATGTKTRPGL